MSPSGLRRRIYKILEASGPDDPMSRRVDLMLMGLILLNLAAAILETVPSLDLRFRDAFLVFEQISVAVFASEYALRLWSCVEAPGYGAPIVGRVRHALTPLAVADLLAFLPALLTLGTADLRFIRVVRLLRLARILKITRYSAATRLFWRVLVATRMELLLSLTLMLILLILASGAMYHAEHEAQPESFSSIPATMWWAIATLTTVGYGDITPITTLGKMIASVIAILGIAMFALPTGILGAAFLEESQRLRSNDCKDGVCPHCGRPIDGSDSQGGG